MHLLRDIGMFMLAEVMLLAVAIDGSIYLYEGIAFLAVYVAYVVAVVWFPHSPSSSKHLDDLQYQTSLPRDP